MNYLDLVKGMAMMAQDIMPIRNKYTYKRDKKKIGRNEPCPCGSGKKYKKCCALANES